MQLQPLSTAEILLKSKYVVQHFLLVRIFAVCVCVRALMMVSNSVGAAALVRAEAESLQKTSHTLRQR